jgi:DNA-binding NtrC family response regulator
LSAYGWPGNVRELINCLETMVVLAQGETLDLEDLPAEIRPAQPAAPAASGIQPGLSLENAERLLIERTLQATAGNRQQAAQMLGIGQRTLYRKLKQYGLAQPTDGAAP